MTNSDSHFKQINNLQRLVSNSGVLGLNVPVGAGVIKAAYGTNKVGGVTGAQKVGLGYHYFMSKRTMLYVDVAHDNKAAKNKSGMDFGIRHTF